MKSFINISSLEDHYVYIFTSFYSVLINGGSSVAAGEVIYEFCL